MLYRRPPRCERECEHCCMICLTNASRRRRTALNGAAHINASHGHKSPHPSIWHYCVAWAMSLVDGRWGWRGGGCRKRRKRQAPPHPSLLTPSERDPSLPKRKQRLHKQGPSLHQTHRCTQIRSAGGFPCGSEASERWSPSTAVVKRDDWRSRTAACTRLRLATRARSSFASTFELSAVVRYGGASGGGGGTSSEGGGGDFMGVGDSNERPRCK